MAMFEGAVNYTELKEMPLTELVALETQGIRIQKERSGKK